MSGGATDDLLLLVALPRDICGKRPALLVGVMDGRLLVDARPICWFLAVTADCGREVFRVSCGSRSTEEGSLLFLVRGRVEKLSLESLRVLLMLFGSVPDEPGLNVELDLLVDADEGLVSEESLLC